jgi:large subunit ribosomal protein L24
MNLRKGDFVLVKTGKDKNKTGEIKKVFPDQNRVVIENINIVKKHQKANKNYPQGALLEKSLPISADNVAIICSHCKKASRIGYKVTDKGKIRICKHCKEALS